MTTVGIDRISFQTSQFYLPLTQLAQARGEDADKFTVGLGQDNMSVTAPDEDIVTIAANAAERILDDTNREQLTTVLFATESGIDQSKAAGVYLKTLLNLKANIRVVELKQACYSGTAALQMACAWVARSPQEQVLLVTSDEARYGLNTSGESSQGCGAVAMMISANPRIMHIEPASGLYTDDVMDFWRPNYREEAFVEGHYSAKVYLHALEQTWQAWQAKTDAGWQDLYSICYHAPVPKLVEKAHLNLAKKYADRAGLKQVKQQVQPTLHYARQCGNAYTASLYMCLASLLDHSEVDLSGQRIGLFSYGSGCVSEFFTGEIQPGYQDNLLTEQHQQMLNERQAISYEQYETFYTFSLPQDGSSYTTNRYQTTPFRFSGVTAHKRCYEREAARPKKSQAEAGASSYCINQTIDSPVEQQNDDSKSTHLEDFTSEQKNDKPSAQDSTSSAHDSASSPHSTSSFPDPSSSFPRRRESSNQTNNQPTHGGSITVASPGKVILSGEHAVLYDQPALAMAINQYTHTQVTGEAQDNVELNLPNLDYKASLTYRTLKRIKKELKHQHQRFRRGEIGVRQVLKAPFELSQYTLATLLDHLPTKTDQPQGLKINTQSSLPVNRGLGSSAASVVSILKALIAFYGLSMSSQQMFDLALESELMQHGQSIGLDLYTSMEGGCLYYDKGQIYKRPVPQKHLWLVDTGTPQVSTGQSVSKVRDRFGHRDDIWQAFAAVTTEIDRLLQDSQDDEQLAYQIQRNQQLLYKIGVVPERVQQFIQLLQQNGMAGKISGAGAVEGDRGGMVLVLGSDEQRLASTCRAFGYSYQPIEPDYQGAHLVGPVNHD